MKQVKRGSLGMKHGIHRGSVMGQKAMEGAAIISYVNPELAPAAAAGAAAINLLEKATR